MFANWKQLFHQHLSQRFSMRHNSTSQPLLEQHELLALQQSIGHSRNRLKVSHPVDFPQSGEQLSHHLGHSMEIEDSRPYMPGDDPRHMNWPLTARSGQLFMKIYREERQPGVFILLDRRQSMRFATRKRLKLTQAVRYAALSAFAANKQNLALSAMILDDNMQWFKQANKGNSLFASLEKAAAAAPAQISTQQECRLDTALANITKVLSSGSIVLLVSDFRDLDVHSQPLLYQLSCQHTVYAIHIDDAAEHALPSCSDIALTALPAEKHVLLNATQSHWQHRYQQHAEQHFQRLHTLFQTTAIPYQIIHCDEQSLETRIPF